VWFRRGRLGMVSPDSQATACLPSGRNSTYRPVQISGTGSLNRGGEDDDCRKVFEQKPAFPASEDWTARVVRRALRLAARQDRAPSPRHVAIPQLAWRSHELAYAHRLDADRTQ